MTNRPLRKAPSGAGGRDDMKLLTPAAAQQLVAVSRMPVEEAGAEDDSCYQVNVRLLPSVDRAPPMMQLSIKRLDKAAFHDRRDLQRIKSELDGLAFESTEIVPAESRLDDTWHQLHR